MTTARARTPGENQLLRSILALLPPLVALVLQWTFWTLIRPYVWFLFYPAIFVSSWIGGLRAGLAATVLSTAMVWWFFVPPQYSLAKDPEQIFPAGVFLGMGILFGIFHDRLRKANEKTSEALAASHAAHQEISRLYEKTKELDELKTQFFANVSHELRTPLALILGPTERLLQAPETSDAARRDLDVVARNARTLLGHVNNLLDLSKLEAGRMRPDYAENDVARLVRFVADHFDVLSKETGTAFKVEAPDLLLAQVDPEKVLRILLNLLSNAFKFTPAGGRVRVTLRATPERILFEVADSGPGIPPDKREAAFERFRQIEGGATRRFGGTGLGLSIARELVLLQQGSISIAEAPEGGALFRVELPRAAPPGAGVRRRTDVAAEVPAELQLALEALRGRKDAIAPLIGAAEHALVLVVEDNPEMNRFISESLADRYRVAAAFDGKEGLAKAKELKPDLILSDVMMPEMSGDELVHAIRSHRELDRTQIVLLTAKADDRLRVQLLREGAQDYLTKPFSVEELRARIGNLVARKRAEEKSRGLAEQIERVTEAHIAVSEAVAGLPEASMDAVLKTMALHAQALTGAEYAAVGIGTDPEKPFAPWVFVGLTLEQAAAIGPRPPRPIGALGVVARDQVIRTRDVRRHHAYRGVPPHHPEIVTFLGVPIRFRGRSVGNLYLGNKRGAKEFSEQDQRLVEMLAARTGVAIETARLYGVEGMERAWLQTVIDQMPEGVVLLDAQGRFTAQNKTLLGLTRRDTGEVDPFGNPVLLDLRQPSGERVPVADYPYVRALLHQEAVVGHEFLLGQGDGRMIPALASAAPILGRAGAIAGATMIVQDISALKELERLREEWASIVAHDLRQPVGVIHLSAELLAKLRPGAAEHEAKTVERIRVAATRLSRMIDDLQDASRIEARRMTIERRSVELPRLIEDVVERMPDAAARVEVRVAPGAREPAWADPGRIEQVLGNLLSNAVKYGEPDTPIRIELAAHEDGVEVTVTNQGKGISPEELPLLFGRFERSREARAGRTAGLGLGLYISRGLIEAHGGRIWVESTLGVSTSFHFTLPLVHPDVRHPEEPRPHEPSLGAPAMPTPQ